MMHVYYPWQPEAVEIESIERIAAEWEDESHIGAEEMSKRIASASNERTWRHVDVIVCARPEQSINLLRQTFGEPDEAAGENAVDAVASCTGVNDRAESSLACRHFGARSIIDGLVDGEISPAIDDAETIESLLSALKEQHIDVCIAEGMGAGVDFETYDNYDRMTERLDEARRSGRRVYQLE